MCLGLGGKSTLSTLLIGAHCERFSKPWTTWPQSRSNYYLHKYQFGNWIERSRWTQTSLPSAYRKAEVGYICILLPNHSHLNGVNIYKEWLLKISKKNKKRKNCHKQRIRSRTWPVAQYWKLIRVVQNYLYNSSRSLFLPLIPLHSPPFAACTPGIETSHPEQEKHGVSFHLPHPLPLGR